MGGDELVFALREGGPFDEAATNKLMEEAANEIERLQKALADIADGMGMSMHADIGRYAPVVAKQALEASK